MIDLIYMCIYIYDIHIYEFSWKWCVPEPGPLCSEANKACSNYLPLWSFPASNQISSFPWALWKVISLTRYRFNYPPLPLFGHHSFLLSLSFSSLLNPPPTPLLLFYPFTHLGALHPSFYNLMELLSISGLMIYF